jgi:hypothetical protein
MIDAKVLYAQMPLEYATSVAAAQVVTRDDSDSSIPADVRTWLVRLRLLEGVPFAHLVADSELLPPESIRWFYIDRRWTDALVEGALSVGTVNSDDRVQLTTAYPAIRDELDTEERNVRRDPTTQRFGGKVDAISGFVLRSRVVAGYPGLHVRAFGIEPDKADDAKFTEDEPERMRLLRLERLAPAVLFCLFDGIPSVVHMEEPRQGVQFGFDASGPPGQVSASLRPRSAATGEYLGGAPVPVPFRSGNRSSGVVDIQELEKRLRGPATGGNEMDSAEYALQLVRFPFRQVWGEVKRAPIATVFTPTIAYQQVAQSFFTFKEG